jgi:2-dehydro-3-deoxyphosphogluconate aldolase/(4S)-4-hydroxy-2-oxoglutarate aldolase
MIDAVDAAAEIVAERFVAILRAPPDLDAVANELVDAGVRVLEITLDTPGAVEAIARWRGHATVLAGTVRSVADAEAALEAGAAAAVSPGTVPEVAAFCREASLPYVPGALTPTEVEAARRAGAPLVKLFPASLGGPAYVRSLRGPLADVPLLATGGVTAENATAFLEAGAAAVGADSSRALAVWEAVRVAR